MSPPRLSTTVTDTSRGYARDYNYASGNMTSVQQDARKNQRTYFSESNTFLELPLAELEPVVAESLLRHPQISYGDSPVWSDEEHEEGLSENESIDGEYDDLETDDAQSGTEQFDLLETPEYEPDDDTRDEVIELSGEIGAAEGLDGYAIRRCSEDFAFDDEQARESVRKLLEEKFQPELSSSNKENKSADTPNWYQTWLNDVLDDYGSPKDAIQVADYQTNVPDIIFSHDGTNLTYDINMGMLDEIAIPQNAVGNINITEGRGVPVAILRHFIAKRKAALGIIAEFLIQRQHTAISSKTIPDVARNLDSIQQKDLIAHIQDLGIDVSVENTSKKSDPDKVYEELKQQVSKMLRGKYVQLPCSDVPIPALALFGRPVKNLKENERALKILKTAFDIHITVNKGKPLTTEEQAKIISNILGVQYSKDTVRRTLWDELKKEYPEDQWPLMKLTGERGRLSKDSLMKDEVLEKLCDEIINRLN